MQVTTFNPCTKGRHLFKIVKSHSQVLFLSILYLNEFHPIIQHWQQKIRITGYKRKYQI
jgi:hypothetical protein